MLSNMQFIDIKSHYLKIVTILNVALGILILIALADLAGSILSIVQKPEIKSPGLLPARPKEVGNEGLQQYESLLKTNPFDIQDEAAKGVSTGAGDTGLAGIKLMGTISGSNKRGYAVFIGKDGKQEMFETGESVFGAGRLVIVEKYRAFIERNGKLTMIPLVDIVAPEEMASLKEGAQGPVRSLSKGEYVIDRKALKFALDNPAQIMTDAKLVPNVAKGKQDGFVLREVRKGGIYDGLGIQNGDILLRINGAAISNPSNALQALMALQAVDRIELDIVRDGARKVMNYQIK